MKNQWPIWIFVVGVVVIVLFAFNYQSSKDVMPLTDIFPESTGASDMNIEYEFVDQQPAPVIPEVSDAQVPARVPAPAVTMTTPVPAPAPVQAARPAVTAAVPAASSVGPAAVVIQVLSSQDKARAEEALKKVQASGFPAAYMASKDLAEKGTWYRIYVGSYASKAEADGALGKVKAVYPDAFVNRP